MRIHGVGGNSVLLGPILIPFIPESRNPSIPDSRIDGIDRIAVC